MTNEDIKTIKVGDALYHYCEEHGARYVVQSIDEVWEDAAGNVAIRTKSTGFFQPLGFVTVEVAFASDNLLDKMGVSLYENLGGHAAWVGCRKRIAGTVFADALRRSTGKGAQTVPHRTRADLVALSEGLVAKGFAGFGV